MEGALSKWTNVVKGKHEQEELLTLLSVFFSLNYFRVIYVFALFVFFVYTMPRPFRSKSCLSLNKTNYIFPKIEET